MYATDRYIRPCWFVVEADDVLVLTTTDSGYAFNAPDNDGRQELSSVKVISYHQHTAVHDTHADAV